MSTSRNYSSIPFIDFSLAKVPERHPEFISQLQNALINVGFFYLVNAPIDGRLVDDLKSYVPKLFALPQEEKDKIRMANSPHFLGYSKLGAELTKGMTDYREQFDIAASHVSRWKPGDPDYYNLWGPPQFPDEHLIPGFKKTLETYLAQMSSLSKEFIALIAEALGLPRDGLSRFFDSDDRMQNLSKIVKYPVANERWHSNQGVGPHYDGGFLTILLQASEHPGLQVQNLAGEWIDVPPTDGTFVINFGRALEFATQGIIRATSHRVLSPPLGSTSPRYSVPFFTAISLDARLCDPEYALEFPEEVLRIRDARGQLVDLDAVNFSEFTSEPSGKVTLINRVKSHPDVAERHYPHLFKKYFPDGLPEHWQS
ncbi:naringenin 3-dioxygenase [Moniliophthora roreri MCA 2997]|uniref:Naringenin 3-dioxygenase n=1 Tax=Moniliophthora roreri (strain MCA 2997) TaxID=1381753 RepID=V2WSD8_MONRO|nr:naringenin 3-dioxygenase [Moniliophthora roreri MCA 2997]